MIEIKGVTKTFGETRALDNMSCAIQSGSVYGLVGSNGSGKSTLLRLLSGVYSQDSGDIFIDGQPVKENISVKSRVFFLADTPFYVHQANTLEMAKFYNLYYERFSFERFNYLTSVFPIHPRMSIMSMSKGMQRQAMLMLALSACPDYLFLDEAFDGLDPVIRQVLKKLLADSVAEHNITVIIASHNLRELEDLCDSIGLLHRGGILLSSELDLVKSRLHKIQGAFNPVPTPDKFAGLDVLKITQSGSLLNMVIRGDRDEVEQKLNALNPMFLEFISPTLEEIFIYEMEVTGYDIRNILN